jgi:CheY-like chemotaxis protein
MNDNVVQILLVEDNPYDAELTVNALRKSHLSSRIDVVRDGAEALDYIFATGEYAERSINDYPRVILLDLKLPKVDGIEVLRQAKSDPRTRHIPIVVLTSSREDRDLTRCYELGANSYIVKPVDFDQFLDVVHQLALYWVSVNQMVCRCGA